MIIDAMPLLPRRLLPRARAFAPPGAWLAVLVCAGMAGCANNRHTTGDPTQGGLFGWSSEKAQARQDELKASAAATRAQAQAEQQRVAALQAQERQTTDTVQRLAQQLKSLEAENDRLDRELAALIEGRQARGADADRLRALLLQSQRVRAEVRADQARLAARQPALAPAPPPTDAQLSAIDAQNRLLHREVLLLLGR